MDQDELQRSARLIELNRQRLTEVREQSARLEAILLEHTETGRALGALVEAVDQGTTRTRIPLGAGVLLPMTLDGPRTCVVDLGSGLFGERTWSDGIEILEKRRHEIEDMKAQMDAEANVLEMQIRSLTNTYNTQVAMMNQEQSMEGSASPDDSVSEPDPEPTTKPARPKRRRSLGTGLTLDD